VEVWRKGRKRGGWMNLRPDVSHATAGQTSAKGERGEK
jgi:hypothetical protein